MEKLQNEIDELKDNQIHPLIFYNNLLKQCANFNEMKAMVYVYDIMKKNNIQPDEYSFQQINKLHSKNIKESSCIIINCEKKKKLEPRRRIHKIIKGYNYTKKYNKALNYKDRVINYLNNNKKLCLIDNRIKLAKIISVNINISLEDSRYIITHLKKINYFNKINSRNSIIKYFNN